uniref:B30.2/SPRY domain-containing protein n=1 Tax=Knipowitschia caucasica TaxID=637954 RepID=A0AAV2J0N1_KNICA
MEPRRPLQRDRSKAFYEGGPDEQSLFCPGSKPTPGPGPSPRALSMKSDSSKNILVEFSAEHQEEQRSVMSDSSKNIIVEFKEEHSEEQGDPGRQEPLDDILRRLQEDVLTFVKEQLQMICRLLATDYPEFSEQNSREVLSITMDHLRRMKQEKLVQRLERRSAVGVCRDELKKHLQQKVSRVFEGVAKAGDSAPLTQIYTELHITEGGASEVNQEHEWSALSFVLLSSESDLQDFDLRKYLASETALLVLLPVVRASTKALLRGCGLSPRSCGPLASVLSSSSLTHLNLSNNDLQDSGIELLCSGLKSPPCGLHTLMLSGCLISQRGGAALASALSPTPDNPSHAPSHLRELDLSYNHPGGSSELLKALQDDPHCPLQELRLDPAGEQWMVPGLRKYSCEFFLDPNTAHRDLHLSEDNRTATKAREETHRLDSEDGGTEQVLNQSRVLSSTGLRGRCYWEVDWCGWRGIDIALGFGDDHRSWSLRVCNGSYSFYHNSKKTVLRILPSSFAPSGRVAVFLDSEAGSLSFYLVRCQGNLLHLHTCTSSFSEPVFPGFGLRSESSVSVVDLSRAPPTGSK